VSGFDLDYPRVAAVVVLVGVNLALVVALATSGAAYSPYNSGWNGADGLRETAAGSAEVHLAVSVETYDEVPADRSVAVVLDPSSASTDTAARVRGFLARGGTLVVAGQNKTATNDYLEAVDATARVDGRPLRDEQNVHRASNLPVAGNVTDHELTAGVDSLTLNNGTAVRHREATPLVNTSRVAYLDADRNGTLDGGDPLGPFPVATVEPVGTGQVVVVSDPSVFTNAMTERAGNGAFVEALFEGRSAVVLDYSQGSSLPPLVYAVLVARETPLAQAAVGTAAFAVLALRVGWGRFAGADGRLRSWLGRSDDAPEVAGLDAAGVEALLADRHPDWDRDRTERVTEAVLRQRRGRGDDE